MENILAEHGVKATANRLVIARALADAHRPLTMTELEDMLETIDKSNIFRALQLFRDAHLVHVLEDTGGGVRYTILTTDTDLDRNEYFKVFRILGIGTLDGRDIQR